MRRLALLLGVLVGILGISTLLAAPHGDCDTAHPGKGKDNPRWCRYCPAPEPDCQIVACSRCGCTYWCPGDATP